MSKGLQLALGALTVAGLIGWYAVSNLDAIGTFRYFETLEEFRDSYEPGQAARVHGFVAPGTIERDFEGRLVRFAIVNDAPHAAASHSNDRLDVVYPTLEIPDLFKDGAEVVVEGRLGEDAVFVADNVLAKCPSKFEPELTDSLESAIEGGSSLKPLSSAPAES